MSDPDSVSFAGLVHEESPNSGVYGGMSVIWFPVADSDKSAAASLLTFVCGTRGLAPDEQILGRPGHVRHLRALRRHLRQAVGVDMWVKHDPTNLNEPVPRVIRDRFATFRPVIDRYGGYIYAAVEVPREPDRAKAITAAFLDVYAWERGWTPLKRVEGEIMELKLALRANLFPRISASELFQLLKQRRFVILQGPPGTGKTRLAAELANQQFAGHALTVQFHPAVTYETFVAGISPDVANEALRFHIQAGWLVRAAREAYARDFLLVLDEVNRADLGRVLGEAIHLFEPREIDHGGDRSITLPHRLPDGTDKLVMPKGLFVLGTMNTADLSIANLDLAVRRRFAFVDLWPDIEVVVAQGIPLAVEAFGGLLDIFAQYAPDEALVLVPGHAYFLADTEAELVNRLNYQLKPLILQYLQEGRLGTCESELRAYVDWLEGRIDAKTPPA
jgi:5-methylcytosine-specific restriction protein B